jgi:hypothetical protein
MSTKFNSLLTVSDYFKDENICKEYLIAQRWNGKSNVLIADAKRFIQQRGVILVLKRLVLKSFQ